jgi:hypothetical protein
MSKENSAFTLKKNPPNTNMAKSIAMTTVATTVMTSQKRITINISTG